MANPCGYLIHHARRRITRHWRRYHAIHIAVALTTGCVGGPAILIHLLPPTIAPPGWTPMIAPPADTGPGLMPSPSPVPLDVPEPASLWVLGAGIAGLVLVRRTRGIGGTGVRA